MRPIRALYVCAVKRQCQPSGCKSRPANSVAPAGSYRSGGGGNEAVGASETHVPPGGAASRQAVTRVNAEQAPKGLMWEPTRHINGEGRRRWATEGVKDLPHERSNPAVPPG